MDKDQEFNKMIDTAQTLFDNVQELVTKLNTLLTAQPAAQTATLEAPVAALDQTTMELLKGWVKHKAGKAARKEVEHFTDDIEEIKKKLKELEERMEDAENDIEDINDSDDDGCPCCDSCDGCGENIDELMHQCISQGILFKSVIEDILETTGHTDIDVNALIQKYADAADDVAWDLMKDINENNGDDDDEDDDDD